MYTNSAINNVVAFQNESIPSVINRFIESYESKNTRDTYTRHIAKMFMYVCGKDTSEITEEDIRISRLETQENTRHS